MLQKIKKRINFMFSRLFLVGLMIAVQIVILFSGAIYFGSTLFYFYFLFHIFSMIAMLWVVCNDENPMYKITWIVAILSFPLIGWLFYVVFGNKRMPTKLRRQIDASLEDTRRHMHDNSLCEDKLSAQSNQLSTQSRYIYNIAGYPLHKDTQAMYFPVGELMFEQMLQELAKAERYIFLEYFIIRPGKMWDSVFEILRQKASEGVEVRLMYDDLGCIGSLPKGYNRIILDAGIRLCVFNPFRPRVSVILNYRDHRKMTIIDGRVVFCGGINLADEYINEYERFGHWKDTGFMLKGDAVWPFAFMFLQQWQFSTDETFDYTDYRSQTKAVAGSGLIQPFGDSPLDSYNITETAYLNIISRATEYVYITTPYLVIDNEMETVLCSAAQSGVDIRIITPYIYDKWYVHMLTRSHYARLIRAGVKIYEYTPGFMHGKMFVADDQVCMIGTCNMDFRSFYLHFECSAAFYYSDIINDVKSDIENCQQVSHQVTLEEAMTVPLHIRAGRAVLKLFAPLM